MRGGLIVVTHHPFDLPEGVKEARLLGRAAMAMEKLSAAGADLFLAGHLHISHIGHTAERYNIGGHSALAYRRAPCPRDHAASSPRSTCCESSGRESRSSGWYGIRNVEPSQTYRLATSCTRKRGGVVRNPAHPRDGCSLTTASPTS